MVLGLGAVAQQQAQDQKYQSIRRGFLAGKHGRHPSVGWPKDIIWNKLYRQGFAKGLPTAVSFPQLHYYAQNIPQQLVAAGTERCIADRLRYHRYAQSRRNIYGNADLVFCLPHHRWHIFPDLRIP